MSVCVWLASLIFSLLSFRRRLGIVLGCESFVVLVSKIVCALASVIKMQRSRNRAAFRLARLHLQIFRMGRSK